MHGEAPAEDTARSLALPQNATPALPFEALLEAAPDAIVIVDATGRIAIVNTQTEQLFGYSRAELLGQPVEVLLPEPVRAMHMQHRAAYAAAPHTRPMGSGLRLAGRRKDGSTFPVEISLSALATASGPLITSAIRDISERQRIETALRASEDRFARVFRSGQVAMLITRLADGRIIDANARFLQVLGYPRDAVLGRTTVELGMFAEASDRAWFNQHFGTHASLPGLETTFRASDGGVRDVLASLERIEVDGEPAILTVFQDITERKRAADELERQVQRRTAHLQALLQFSQELLTAHSLDATLQRALSHALALLPEAQRGAIYLYDADGQHLALRASAGFSTLPELRRPLDLGLVGRAFTGRRPIVAHSAAEWVTLTQVVPTESRPRLLHALQLTDLPSGVLAIPLLAHGEAIGVLLLLRLQGDGPFAVEARAALEGLANLTAAAIGEAQSARAAAALSSAMAQLEEQQRSMAERMTVAEAAMLQSARLAAVGQLAASVAHEINNPLYATRNCLYLLEQDLPAELQGGPYLALARDQLGRIAGIIERMREFYRPTRADMAAADLNALLEDTLALAKLQMPLGAIEIVFAPALDLPPVMCAADQLRQVFLNLILNAIDAMPHGGTLTVCTAAGPTVVVAEVQDTGVGIPDDVRARLFDPFFTTKATGTGLGLSISAHIVTQHGGQIDVQSREGRGTTFRVVLPLRPSNASIP